MSELVHLPSYGRIYESYPENGLDIRPWKIAEVKALYNLHSQKDQTSKIFDIIQGCVSNFNVKQLSEGDLDYLFYWFRIKTYMKFPLILKFSNPSTGKQDSVTIELKNLNIKSLEDRPDVTYWMPLTTSEGKTIHVRYPTLDLREHVARHMKASKLEGKIGDEYLTLMSLLIKEISDTSDNMTEAVNRVSEELSPDDLVMIEQHLESITHGVDQVVVINSVDIDGEPMTYERKWELDVTNFFPFR